LSACLAAGSSFEAAELFLVTSDAVRDGLEGGAQVRDLVGQAGQGARVGLSRAVLVDDSAETGIAVEGGSAHAGEISDRDERDLLATLEQLGAGALNANECGLAHVRAA
jgi:hypothetical protein